VKSTILDRFNAEAGDTGLTLVGPIVVEVSADRNILRHSVPFIRARPELDPAAVEPPVGNP
jgi:hypothetical protein